MIDARKPKRPPRITGGIEVTDHANRLCQHSLVVVASNGGSNLIYQPTGDQTLAAKVVAVLSAEDYTSGLFVDDHLGRLPGTLPLSAIALPGTAVTPMPASANIGLDVCTPQIVATCVAQ
jgi:hypothetical protein